MDGWYGAGYVRTLITCPIPRAATIKKYSWGCQLPATAIWIPIAIMSQISPVDPLTSIFGAALGKIRAISMPDGPVAVAENRSIAALQKARNCRRRADVFEQAHFRGFAAVSMANVRGVAGWDPPMRRYGMAACDNLMDALVRRLRRTARRGLGRDAA